LFRSVVCSSEEIISTGQGRVIGIDGIPTASA
jgi:hypothetical protein